MTKEPKELSAKSLVEIKQELVELDTRIKATKQKLKNNNQDLKYKVNYYVMFPKDNYIFRKSHIKRIEVQNQ